MRIALHLRVVFLTCGLGAAFAPAASADYSATLGPITATLSQPGGASGPLTLHISRDGSNYADDTINSAVCGSNSYCEPASDSYDGPAVAIAEASGLTEPDVERRAGW